MELLVEKAKDNDRQAKETIIKNFEPLVIKLSISTYIESYEAQDIQNECYKTLLQCIGTYDLSRHRFVAYATMAINNSVNSMIKTAILKYYTQGFGTMVIDAMLEDSLCSDEPSYEDQLILSERNKSISDNLKLALKTLKPKELELIDYLYYKKCSTKKYAALKGYTYAAVAHRKLLVLKKLRKKF